MLLAGVTALLAFLLANPYALLDYSRFHAELAHQSALSAESQGKLGAPREGGIVYYMWSLAWGLGWLPAIAALGGALTIWRSDRAVGWVLVPAPVLFLAFMGLQGRYFGRWLMPIIPILCLLAAFAAVELLRTVARLAARYRRDPPLAEGAPRSARRRPDRAVVLTAVASVVVVGALLAQGAVHSIHSGLVLSRADTRTLTRRWMLANIPRGAHVVVEPVAPQDWAQGATGASSCGSFLWCPYPVLNSHITASGSLRPTFDHSQVGIEDYVRTLAPALLGYYRSSGYCWVVTGSTQRDRAFADPAAAPLAIAYYRALEAQGEVVYRSSPFAAGRAPVGFNFDWSFDYYPLAYRLPGPTMTIYRLRGGRCGREADDLGGAVPKISWEVMPNCSETDNTHLARAIELAANGGVAVRPNPVVGAVVARRRWSSARAGIVSTVARTPR